MTTQLTVRYRPLRIGFVARDGDLAALERTAALNTLLWGGVRNPIIPVGQSETLVVQLLKLFNVDALVPVGDAPEATEFIKEYPYLRISTFCDGILGEDWDTKKKTLEVVDVVHLIKHWQTEFRHKPDDFVSNCALVEWHRDDVCSLPFQLSFGTFAQDLNLKTDFRRAFERGLKAQTIRVDKGGTIPAALATVLSPLAFTSEHATPVGPLTREPGFFVGSGDSFDDLAAFWNLRAAGIWLLFLPFQHLDRYSEIISKCVNKFDSQPARFRDDVGDISLYYRSSCEEAAEEVAHRIESKKQVLRCEYSEVLWNGLNIIPDTLRWGGGTALGHVDQIGTRSRVTFQLPQQPFPLDDRRPSAALQHHVAVVDPLEESEYPDHTLKPPPLRSLNEFLSREIAIDPWKVRVESDGLGLVVRLHDSAKWLHPVEHKQLILALFETVGIAADPSPAGRLANQIVKSMRESDPLEACRVFKIRGVRKLIRRLSSVGDMGWNEALAIIGTENFGKHKNLHIEARTARYLYPQDVLRFLLEKKVLRPSLRMWETLTLRRKTFRCKTCGLKSTILAKRFEGEWQCPYCQAEHYLPALVGSEFQRPRAEWRLQRSGLFAKNNNQEGALPVILTLLQLKRGSSSLGSFMYSPGLYLRGATAGQCEVDFAVLEYGYRNRIELGIAECKDEGGIIDQKDVDNLLAVRAVFDRSDIQPYIIFAKTSDAFRPDEIERFHRLSEDGVQLILFTNRELEPYDPYEDFDGESLPARYALTLEDMARNSVVIYLRQ